MLLLVDCEHHGLDVVTHLVERLPLRVLGLLLGLVALLLDATLAVCGGGVCLRHHRLASAIGRSVEDLGAMAQARDVDRVLDTDEDAVVLDAAHGGLDLHADLEVGELEHANAVHDRSFEREFHAALISIIASVESVSSSRKKRE